MKAFEKMPSIRVRNLLFLIVVTSIVIVLDTVYISNCIRGTENASFVIMFCAILNAMLVFDIMLYWVLRDTITTYGYVTLIAFFVFYTYQQYTTDLIITASYIIPIQFVISSYNDKKMQFVSNFLQSIILFVVWGYRYSIGDSDVTSQEFAVCMSVSIITVVTAQITQFQDIQTLRRKQELENDVLTDTLTGCYNRRFIDSLEVKNWFRDSNVSVILGDINEFKKLNDTLGHTKGDIALIRVGHDLHEACGDNVETYPIRIGGDEFVIVTKDKHPEQILDKVRNIIDSDETLKSFSIEIKVAFGLAKNLTGRKVFHTLYEEADKEMYSIKEAMKKKKSEKYIK